MTRSTRRLARLRVAALGVAMLAAGAFQPWRLLAQAPVPSQGVRFATISEADMREYLTYLSSDTLQGRQVFTEGYGLALSYVAEHLRDWGLKPMGDDGTYFQSVKQRGYEVTNNSSITVEVNGQSRTFKHGDHVTFPTMSGGKQTLSFDGVEFVGYGTVNLDKNYDDFRGRDVKGKLVAYLGGTPSVLIDPNAGGRGGRRGGNRNNFILQTYGAGAVLSFAPAPPPPSPEAEAARQGLENISNAVAEAQAQLAAAGRGGRGAGRGFGRGGRGAAPQADLTTVQDVEAHLPAQITADETFYDFLFSAAPTKFADLRARSENGDPLVPMTIPAKVTVNVDATYNLVSTQLTKNVVGMVEGTDPQLKDTYVFFGAHLDHVGYRTSATAGRGGRGGQASAGPPDLIYNGADDDGSGSTGLLGIAKAFATGPKPKRSVIFVWHAGEEAGLLGSRYMADFPVVPLEKVQAQLNIDMIGRNRDNDESMSNTVFVIGADRISTDLHNLLVETDATLRNPVTLDYEYNDPSDTNSFYTRSDHYSYAAKGIPIAFFFTGTHPDYHQASDSVEKILFPKLTHIAQLVYETGFNIANSERTLTRDNKGPRAGKGFSGKIVK
ncbi:MAG: M28 family peptidase [Vicinamibacterales bacterium]